MAITLQLKPEIEAHLLDQASKNGVSIQTYIESLIEERLSLTSEEQSVPNLEALLDELVIDDLPPLTAEMMSRETIY